ncbi:hypothetical protein PUN50_02135 [Vibrio campbellii]|uniref:Uncharacterized protein n=1 Tax=Vibrio campbellii TaxID=680 RepID=A0AAQ2Y1U3_9VIBR|nr:hypothetical protein [Vibrio campbellii]WDG09911.1 hypothetical protein PUN50_02135 [Vibrio campbellii]
MLVPSRGRSLKTLISTMPIVEISTYFSIDRLLPELNWVADAAVNATNVEKVQAIQTELERLVFNDSISAPLTLTFAVVGKPNLKGSSNLTSSLKYDSSDTYVVGNVLGMVAICKILGLKTFLFSSRLSVKEANSQSELRQRLAMESVEIRVVFDDQQGLSSADVIELFKQSRTFDSSMSLPHIVDAQGAMPYESYPLRSFIKELIARTDMESYGDVNFNAKHVKVSERYIATEYVLFKLIVGAVAGVGTQDYSKMSKDITLNSGERISSVLSSGYIDFVVAFMKGWLESLREAFVDNRSGYHLSPQVWLALGLTIHQLVSNGASCEDLKIAGKVLGQLNYSKNAKHWSNCSVMELDSKGRIYKNAAGSTRQFRVGLFEYFFAVLNVKK